VERVARFFGTHTLQFKVPKDSIQDMQRALEECEYLSAHLSVCLAGWCPSDPT